MEPIEYFLTCHQGSRLYEGLNTLNLSENLDSLDNQIHRNEVPPELTDLKYIRGWRQFMQTDSVSDDSEDEED